MTPLMDAHLWRLLTVSGLGMVISLFGLRVTNDRWKGFFVMTLAWSIIDAIIGIAGIGKDPGNLPALRELLMLNLGLNAGYCGVGITMGRLGKPFVQGMGWAVLVQGAILFGLDGFLLSQLPVSQ